MISIIVPVYNVEKYIHQCLDSILQQTYTHWECILIDDGSHDSSGQICDEYAKHDPRIRVFHQPNSGVSAARNVGLDNARGELITFIDSDDWVEENYCHTIVNNIGDADIMYFSEVWHYNDGCVVVYSSGACCVEGKENMEKEMFHMLSNTCWHNFFGYTWNKVFKASIIRNNNIRFVEKLSISEDEVFTLDYCKHVKVFKNICAPIYNYRFFFAGLTVSSKSISDWILRISSLEKSSSWLTTPTLKDLYLRQLARFKAGAIYVESSWLKRPKLFFEGYSYCKSIRSTYLREVWQATKTYSSGFFKSLFRKVMKRR